MTTIANADRVPVLMYHRVGNQGAGHQQRYCVTPRQFASHLDWLAEHRYQPCTIGAFDRWLHAESTLPPRSVLITFDDGFSGLHEHALPLLSARGWPATVFLVSGLIGQRDVWMSSGFGTAGAHSLLHAGQIAEMARHGIEFHSHSRTHQDLTTLSARELTEQIHGSRQDLQQLLGGQVEYFAYPFGRFDARVRSVVASAGYRLAFSVNPGFNRVRSGALEVRRLDVVGADARAHFGRKVSMGTNNGSITNQLRYLAGRLVARFPN